MKRAVRAIIVRDNHLLVIKRNKFGNHYFTLVGGHIELNETAEQALVREVYEETGLEITHARLVFIEEAGEPYGTQYIYLCEDPGGKVAMHPAADEAHLNKLGQNTYQPVWLPLDQLSESEFLSKRLKRAILDSLEKGFPQKPTELK
jgi:8-oxo-dGTP diphosphatase